jgi:hypothetical protein
MELTTHHHIVPSWSKQRPEFTLSYMPIRRTMTNLCLFQLVFKYPEQVHISVACHICWTRQNCLPLSLSSTERHVRRQDTARHTRDSIKNYHKRRELWRRHSSASHLSLTTAYHFVMSLHFSNESMLNLITVWLKLQHNVRICKDNVRICLVKKTLFFHCSAAYFGLGVLIFEVSR